MSRQFWLREEGFSLIECALVLMILGILAGYGVPWLKHQQIQRCHQLTKQRQQRIVECLKGYFCARHALPSPWQTPQGSEKIDIEGIRAGFIPYRTLGLVEEETRDGFNEPFHYIIDCHVETNSKINITTFNEKLASRAKEGKGIIIKNIQDEEVLQPSSENLIEKNRVAFVIVSHVPPSHDIDTYSAVEEQNRRTLKAPNVNEVTLIDRPYSLNTADPFRYRLKWVTMFDLMIYFYDEDVLKKEYRIFFKPTIEASTDSDVLKGPHSGNNLQNMELTNDHDQSTSLIKQTPHLNTHAFNKNKDAESIKHNNENEIQLNKTPKSFIDSTKKISDPAQRFDFQEKNDDQAMYGDVDR